MGSLVSSGVAGKWSGAEVGLASGSSDSKFQPCPVPLWHAVSPTCISGDVSLPTEAKHLLLEPIRTFGEGKASSPNLGEARGDVSSLTSSAATPLLLGGSSAKMTLISSKSPSGMAGSC